MPERDYTIIFKKLSELQAETEHDSTDTLPQEEYDEIDELRRLSMEIQNPEPQSYTTT